MSTHHTITAPRALNDDVEVQSFVLAVGQDVAEPVAVEVADLEPLQRLADVHIVC